MAIGMKFKSNLAYLGRRGILYYLCSEKKCAKQLRGLQKAKSRFSHDMAHYELLTCVSVVGKLFLKFLLYEGIIQFKNTKTVMQTYMYLLLSRLHMAQDKFCHSLAYIVKVKKM